VHIISGFMPRKIFCFQEIRNSEALPQEGLQVVEKRHERRPAKAKSDEKAQFMSNR
jgi:hypothetical protein